MNASYSQLVSKRRKGTRHDSRCPIPNPVLTVREVSPEKPRISTAKPPWLCPALPDLGSLAALGLLSSWIKSQETYPNLHPSAWENRANQTVRNKRSWERNQSVVKTGYFLRHSCLYRGGEVRGGMGGLGVTSAYKSESDSDGHHLTCVATITRQIQVQ